MSNAQPSDESQQDLADNAGGFGDDEDTVGALCLCPSWAHTPDCRCCGQICSMRSSEARNGLCSDVICAARTHLLARRVCLPAPVPAQHLQSAAEQRLHPSAPQDSRPAARGKDIRDISLPSWSKSSRATRPTAFLKPLTYDVCGGGDGGAGRSSGGNGGAAKVLRMQGAYPRLIGADSRVVLYDLNEAQCQLSDLQDRLIKREAEIAHLNKTLVHRRQRSIHNGCQDMPRRAALVRRSRAWALWRAHVSRQKLLKRQAQLEHELESKQTQMADEQRKHQKVVEIMAKRLNEIPALMKKIDQLKAEINSHTLVKQLAEEKAKERIQVLKDALDAQSTELKRLQKEMDERELLLLDQRLNLKVLNRQKIPHRDEVTKLNNELQDNTAQLKRLLQHHTLLHDEADPSSKKLTALQGYAMLHEEGFKLVRQTNARHYQADPLKKLGIFATKDFFFCRLELMNGRPLVSSEEHLLKRMRQEFYDCTDPRVHLITTKNNGLLSTDLQTEWEFAAGPIAGKVYPGQYGHPEGHKLTISRSSTPLTELMQAAEAQGAELMRAEVLALRLYTGPAYTALNGALREGRFIKGKKECPRTVYFDMPSLIENMMEEAGKEDWIGGSSQSKWFDIWSSIVAQMNLSDVLTVNLTEAIEAAKLGPRTAVLINFAKQRVIIVEVTMQGSVWKKFENSETVFIRRAPAEIKRIRVEQKKREKQKQDEEYRKVKEREEEELQRWEKEQEEKRAARKAAQDGVDHFPLLHTPDASAHLTKADETVTNPEGENEVRGVDQHKLETDPPQRKSETDPLAATAEDLLDADASGFDESGFDVFHKIQEKYRLLQETWKMLLGRDWHVGVYPVIAESFGEISGVTATFPPVPEEWCCSGNSEGMVSNDGVSSLMVASECTCAGCIHGVADALLIPAERRLDLATTMLRASVQNGCGKQDYGACLDQTQCEKCRSGEPWSCPDKRKSPCANCAPGADSFTYTIAAANSAIIKLCKHSTLPPGGLLYRGVEGLTLPFQDLDDQLKIARGRSNVCVCVCVRERERERERENVCVCVCV